MVSYIVQRLFDRPNDTLRVVALQSVAGTSELGAPSGNGRCSFIACSTGAVIHVSISTSVLRMTGIALG